MSSLVLHVFVGPPCLIAGLKCVEIVSDIRERLLLYIFTISCVRAHAIMCWTNHMSSCSGRLGGGGGGEKEEKKNPSDGGAFKTLC